MTSHRCASIAIYHPLGVRMFDLHWDERSDSVIMDHDGTRTTLLMKPDATLKDALDALGTYHVEIHTPSVRTGRDTREHLQSPLLRIRDQRIILCAPGIEYAGTPPGW